MMSVNTLWYVGRSTGLVSLALFTVAVVLGICARSGRPLRGLPRFAVSGLHRNASLLALFFLILHVLTLVFDRYAKLRWFDLVVPFTTIYRPLWVGLGTAAADLAAAVVVTSLVRHRIGVGPWRLVHWSVYALWPLAVAHTLGSGTDNTSPWLIAVVALCVAPVAGALVWRFSNRFAEYPQPGNAPGPVLPSAVAENPAPYDRRPGAPRPGPVTSTGPLPRVRLDPRR